MWDLLIIFWIGSALALIGTILNTYKVRFCFILWFISNCIMTVQSYTTSSWNQMLIFSIYILLAVIGYVNWKKISTDTVRLSALPSDIQDMINLHHSVTEKDGHILEKASK